MADQATKPVQVDTVDYKDIPGYSTYNLPPFLPGTANFSVPRPGQDVVVCFAPIAATLPAWGQTMHVEAGTAHVAQDAEKDQYPNKEYHNDYVTGQRVSPDVAELDYDPRARFLRDFWRNEHGIEVTEFYVATKTRPNICLGEVHPDAYGTTFTNHEGEKTLGPGVVHMSLVDPTVRWFVDAPVREKKYTVETAVF